MTDIAFFLVSLDGGGAEKVMLTLADGFAAKGLKVDLVLAKLEGEYLSSISPNIRVINLFSPRLISSLPALIGYLKQYRPQVLISALEDPNTIAILAKLLARVPTRVVITVHNPLALSYERARELKRKLTPFLVRWLFPYADAIVAVSQGVANGIAKLSRIPIDRIDTIYNPIFTPDILAKFDEHVEHPWLSERQIPVILGIGRLSQEKDFGTLIRAFALVKQHYPAKLIILGQGSERPYLESLVQELHLEADVDLPGFVSNPYAYTSKVSILAMTSKLEGFGNVLVEGMLGGIPVVSTDCESGPSEILDNGKYGDLVAVGDEKGLAAAIISTLKNPHDPEVLRQRGREFSLESALSKYQKVCGLR
jgi:glycosyltransferase involved in cell wall biosynthesis